MSKKIVAIGGGKNGRIKSDGTKDPYETKEIDHEIVKLTNKKFPKFLFLGHAQTDINSELEYFHTMKKIYGDIFGCECRKIKRIELKNDIQKVKELIEWADIIYEGGGDTKGMIELWYETGFDKMLKEAWMSGKVMCGISAGANCWFKSCSSDSLKIQLNDITAPMIQVECLNFVKAFFTPHCNRKDNYTNRLEHMKESLQDTELFGLGISDCCAIEIVDDTYRLITTNMPNARMEPFGVKAYWDQGKYLQENIKVTKEFKKWNDLLDTKKD